MSLRSPRLQRIALDKVLRVFSSVVHRCDGYGRVTCCSRFPQVNYLEKRSLSLIPNIYNTGPCESSENKRRSGHRRGAKPILIGNSVVLNISPLCSDLSTNFLWRLTFTDNIVCRRGFSSIGDLTTTTNETNNNDDLQPHSNENKIRSPAKEPRNLDQVVYHLQADIRRKRRIHKAEIHNAVELIEKARRVDNFGSFLLNCCCDILPDLHPTYRIGLAKRIWNVIQQSKEFSQGNFEAMLKSLALNEDDSSDPFQYLDEAEAAGISSPTIYFFSLLIVCQRGDLESAVEILNRMKSKNMPVNENFFNVLILGNARSGNLKGAEDILNIMRASNIQASEQTWVNLLRAYIEAGKVKLMKKTLSRIVGSGLSEDQFYELLKGAGRQSNEEILNLVIDWAKASQKMHSTSLISVTTQLMYLNHVQNALQMVLQFSEVLKQEKRDPLGSFFIKELHATNLESEGYLNIVMSLQGEDRNPYALNMAAESCMKHGKLDFAYKVFEGMIFMKVPVRPHYFLPAFMMEFQKNGISGAMHVLKQMKSFRVHPDWEMLVEWIVPSIFQQESSMLEVAKIIKDTCGTSYSSGILSAVLIVALKEKRIDEAIAVVKNLKGKVVNPEVVLQSLLTHVIEHDESVEERNLSAIADLLKFISENTGTADKHDYVGTYILKLIGHHRNEEAARIVSYIQSAGLTVSNAASESIKEKLNTNINIQTDPELGYMSSKHLPHPSEMNVTALEGHKEELESKNLNARGTYRKLFLKYCQTGDLNKALEIKTQFEKEGGELSLGMKSALMGTFIRNSTLEPAMDIFKEISSNNESSIEIDPFKIIDLAGLMIEKDRITDGIELLHQQCPLRSVRRPETLSRNIVRLLENLSQATSSLPHSDDVSKLTEFFVSTDYIKPSNPSLAPSIKDLIRKRRLEDAVLKLETYTEKFRLTPCLQELTYAVINKADAELLERVLKCSSLVKGSREAKRLLAIARSDMGDIDAAAGIFRELGVELSFTSIINQCEYLSSKNELNKMLNLINSVHKTERNYDCKKLYDVAIKMCKRSGDKRGLAEVLSAMEDQDLYVPQSLKALVR